MFTFSMGHAGFPEAQRYVDTTSEAGDIHRVLQVYAAAGTDGGDHVRSFFRRTRSVAVDDLGGVLRKERSTILELLTMIAKYDE